MKVNCDGSALTNPEKIGVGVIVRDHQGHFIHAIACPLSEGTNNLVETEASIIGVKCCVDNGFTKIQLEAHSNLLMQWLDRDATPSCNLVMQVQKIKNLCQ